jgi:membrane fusion protein, multidrug efflux system
MMQARWQGLVRSISGETRTRAVMIGLGLLLLVVFVIVGTTGKSGSATGPAAPAVVRVEAAITKRAEVPIFIDGLGTVQALYTVTVSSRVDGELQKVGFVEGQMVKPGDLLAQIDPRPYQAAFDQAVAAKAKDVAQLANARRDLERYLELAPEEFTSKQTLDTQRALVDQLVAQIAGDQATIDSARTQLDYATIRSPIAGRTGNIVHANSGTGIVVVTQVQPISVIFTLPADALQGLQNAMASGPVTVTAVSRDGKNVLGSGVIGLIDNLIDQATGMMHVKASFPNRDNLLWPGDFVNARVRIQTRKGVLVVPSSAIQRGPDGVFVYAVKADSTVEMRRLEIGEDSGGVTIVEKGLQEGERVTTSNQYRLQPGARVQILTAGAGATAPAPGSKTP